MEQPINPHELEALVKKVRCDWEEDPIVELIGWGLGERAGKPDKGVCIIFWVKEKLPTERQQAAKGTRTIPPKINGIPTDVQVKRARPLAGVGSRGDVIADPLNGGWNTSNADEHTIWFNGWGTLGLLCTNNSDGALMALSNWHVWADGGEIGATIIQPAHPRTGEHVEGITKVAACGPLFTSLLEWESPDPLTWGLYGGAAAAAVAAALSDYKDPIRRGQEATPTDPAELTKSEEVTVEVEYPDLPIPGLPFRSDVKWRYERLTDSASYVHKVSEPQINAQFLLGKYVTTDQATYRPGEAIRIEAALWDYQLRPCDSYHVVAHLIPDHSPQVCHRVLLGPVTCSRRMPGSPPTHAEEKSVCYSFERHAAGETFPASHAFDWLRCYSIDKSALRITDWLVSAGHQDKGELLISSQGLRFMHAPCALVRVRVAKFFGQAITLDAYDLSGNLLGSKATGTVQNVVEELEIRREGIASTRIRGGGGEGVLLEYCVESLESDALELALPEKVAERLKIARIDVKDWKQLRARRCCFGGAFRVPPSEKPGRWTVYLTAQTINHVPPGTEASAAAGVIGGHVVGAPVAQVALCAFMMLGDHVFDIF
jgi:hypothetical protein